MKIRLPLFVGLQMNSYETKPPRKLFVTLRFEDQMCIRDREDIDIASEMYAILQIMFTPSNHLEN